TEEDDRQCSLCQKYGDLKLLYLGQNEWAHVNCCLWSAEVFEEDYGSLLHVHSAVTRGRLMRCERCNKTGATVGCCLTSCQSNYHFMCARSRQCVFQDDKKVYFQNPTTITQLLAHSGNGAMPTVSTKKPRKNAKTPKDEGIPESKKPKKKKEQTSSKKSMSANLPENLPMTPAESAEAIINQAMASNYTPKWSGLRSLSPSSLVLPPGLLIEPEPPASPPSSPPAPTPTPAPATRPRTHVRMKRVSSLSDRIVTKKSKVDFLPPDPPSEIEERRKPSISNRNSGVRIKTPTVKGILNLDELKEERLSDSESSG
uniref:[histone H3]-lysine(4) N-methyltransferase n=1 Tax=Periophthalmus magnuspinnatus TaxID=409849 RepID=A0A3B3ZLW7_9GOBI